MFLRQLLSLVLISGLMTACGFHLRGSYNIPSELSHLQLRIAPHSPLTTSLRTSLQQAGIQLDETGYILAINHDILSKQTSTTDNRAKAAEYTLVYDVEYQLLTDQNTPIKEPRRLLLRRSYQYDTTAIVGKSEEENTLIQELHNEAAQQILRQISSFHP